MGAMISFGDSAEEIWVRQSMIYRTILRDVIAIAPRDEQVLTELEGKLAVNGLLFDLLDTDLARRILLPLKQVVVAIVNDKMLPGMTWKETCISRAYEGRTSNDCIEAMRKSAAELLEMLIRYERTLMSRRGGSDETG